MKELTRSQAISRIMNHVEDKKKYKEYIKELLRYLSNEHLAAFLLYQFNKKTEVKDFK